MILVRHLSLTAAGFINLKGIPSGPVALSALSGLTFLFASFLNAEGKVKTHRIWQKVFSNGYNTGMFLESFTDFFHRSSILTLGIRIADRAGFLSRIGRCNIYIVVIVKNISCFFWIVSKATLFSRVTFYNFSYDSFISAKGFDCIPR